MAERPVEGGGEGGRPRLGEILLRRGVVTLAQVQAALGHQKRTGTRIGKSLVDLGSIDENTLVRFLATQLRVPGANLNKMEIPPEVQRLVPLEQMLGSGVLPLKVHENTLYLGMIDPADAAARRRVRVPAGMKLAVVALPQSQWQYAMDFFRRVGVGIRTLSKVDARRAPRAVVDLAALLEEMTDLGGSALHLAPEAPPTVRAGRERVRLSHPPLTDERIRELVLPRLGRVQRERLAADPELECGLAVEGVGALRATFCRSRGGTDVVLQPLPEGAPALEELGLPPWLLEVAGSRSGLVLIAAPPGHGATTTLHCLLDLANATRRVSIVAVEDPVERLHPHKAGTVTQREVGADVGSIAAGLRLALRQDADLLVAGDLPDLAACEAALAGAEAGRLVLVALRAPDAAAALDFLVESFPEARRHQVRSRVADALQLVFAQRLLPRAGGDGRVPAWERLGASARVREAVRDRRVGQLRRSVERGAGDYETLEDCVGALVRGGVVRFEDGLPVVGDVRRYETVVRTG